MSRTDDHYEDENNCFWLEANEHFGCGCMTAIVIGIITGLLFIIF